jgi:hypothetical protein
MQRELGGRASFKREGERAIEKGRKINMSIGLLVSKKIILLWISFQFPSRIVDWIAKTWIGHSTESLWLGM